MSEFTFKVEMVEGQPQRQVDADNFREESGWLIFFRRGVEYWRANTAKVVSMETKRTPKGDDHA
jgi:hypothetical protein